MSRKSVWNWLLTFTAPGSHLQKKIDRGCFLGVVSALHYRGECVFALDRHPGEAAITPMEDEASDFSSDSEDDGRTDAWSWVTDLHAACSYCKATQSVQHKDTHTYILMHTVCYHRDKCGMKIFNVTKNICWELMCSHVSFKHKRVLTTLFILFTLEWELVLVLYSCAVWACTGQSNHSVSLSTHSLWSELSSMLVWTGTMCQIISLHAQPQSHSGTYKGILHKYAHLLCNNLSFKGPERWLCSRQHLRNPSLSFSLFLWENSAVMLIFKYHSKLQVSYSRDAFAAFSERERPKNGLAHERNQWRWCFFLSLGANSRNQ